MEFSEKQIKILDVAEELIAKNGFVGTSVRDIAKKAEVNVAMISYYFGSKEKLLQQLLVHRTENSRILLKTLKQDDHMNPWKKIDAIVDFYVDSLLENRRFHTIMSRQISLVQDKDTLDLLVKIKTASRKLIQEILLEGEAKGVFRKVNIPFTIASVIGTISQVCMSRPFYSELFAIKSEKEDNYFKIINPELKIHLKSMMHNHLALKEEENEK